MSGAAFKLEITEGQIQNAVAIALAESFSQEKRDAMFRDVIRAHLSVRENTYDKETLLTKRVGTMIRAAADEAVKLKLDELKPEIMKIVSDSLGSRFAESIYAQVRQAVANVTVSSIRVTAELDASED
jgi:hypothetical protein